MSLPGRALLWTAVVCGCSSSGGSDEKTTGGPPAGNVALPGGEGGIEFDDLRFSPELHRILAPGSRVGNIYIVDPDTLAVSVVGGFTNAQSLDAGGGLVFVVDTGSGKLAVVDPAMGTIVRTVPLPSRPDYVRFVPSTGEVWVTEPADSRLDVFTIRMDETHRPIHAAFIALPGAPEGLAVDVTHGRAYTQMPDGKLVSVDIAARAVADTWETGCMIGHGIPPVDEARGFVFGGCHEIAQMAVLSVGQPGAALGTYKLGEGASILAYAPALRHFYLRGDPGAPVAVLAIPSSGIPELLGTFEAEIAGHGAAADDRGVVWVCDAKNGQLLRFVDTYAATK